MKSKIFVTILKLTALISLLFPNIIFAQEENQWVVISGIIGGDNKGFNKVYCREGMHASVQNMKLGSFEFKIPFEKPIYLQLYTQYDYELKHRYNSSIGLLIDKPGKMEVVVENIDNGFDGATVTGLQSAVLYHSVNKSKRDINDRIDELTKMKHGKSSVPGEDPEFESIKKTRDSLENILLDPFLLGFINRNKDAYVGVLVLFEHEESLDLKEVISNHGAFPTELQNSTYGKNISDYIEGAQNSQIGSNAKTFTLQTNEDLPYNFDQLKGKYIVLDFWASWCRPCREAFPRMREINAKYQEKGLQFLNVSIDENKQSWLEVVNKENNPWPQLLDDQGLSKKLYGVAALPVTYLIDTEGKIIVKEIGFNPRGNGVIERKLKQIFGF
ncbi:MAG TPA: TlpA disulfide reductase family protein [Cyclobacteriaceae bacterium]|nr:TlpA disulfide reductase family protein [Cyclobacteriaceae bacterium]